MKGKPLFILSGPTGVGKTDISIRLAKDIGGEIISADSMQVYRFMDIGSGKIRPEEMQGIPHHLIDILDPKEPFDVQCFQKKAKEAISGIYERDHIPILVGGTGFYIQSVLYDVDFAPEKGDDSYRRELLQIYEEGGQDELYETLKQIDPLSAEKIPVQNKNRLIRALEFYKETGMPISKNNAENREKESPYDFRYAVLTRDRAEMYRRIEKRVDKMMEDGFTEEVRFLKEYGCRKDMTSMQGLGYKQLLQYLNGEISEEEAVFRTKTETRHFAKRQLTWFRREKSVTWIDWDKGNYDDVRKLGDFR